MKNRREFLRSTAKAGVAMGVLPSIIRQALAIEPQRRTGTIEDIEHIVVFMQENRSFDHYFGTLAGVRGFGDRFPIPVPDRHGRHNATVWNQINDEGTPRILRPFHLDTARMFELMRVKGTPHTWSNAQDAWDMGRMHRWPVFKQNHSMAYFAQGDLPFQFALAQAFTVCDAYHCSFTGGTNTNRLFAWTGSNDGLGRGNGPALGNTYNTLSGGDPARAYTWTSYPERLQRAGIRWRIYQDMNDNYSLNPMAGFKTYRDAYHHLAGSEDALRQQALSTHDLASLEDDVRADRLPQVSWICATKTGSEHPSPSSPAQGADYTARVLKALTANPQVWSKTVLLLMFDENDGFFDHMPPPAPPSRHDGPPHMQWSGASTVDTTGEYHEIVTGVEKDDLGRLCGATYGLGPRVPMYVISPWTRGGWVNSEVFDHTSILQFIERRFGVAEPNISAWRRAVCGDLTSIFDFTAEASAALPELPPTAALATRAGALPQTTLAVAPDEPAVAYQSQGTRPSRALPYALHIHEQVNERGIELEFINAGQAAAVFHVYDRRRLEDPPRRYTVEAGKQLRDVWQQTPYDLWVLGPNGYHWRYAGNMPVLMRLDYRPGQHMLQLTMVNRDTHRHHLRLAGNTYGDLPPQHLVLQPGGQASVQWSVAATGRWYDVEVDSPDDTAFYRRMAGRMENGQPSVSDPAMGGPLKLTV
ncbi:phosphocholine-specific phospholipase C [Bordetella holmesii]|uniref:phospholipase C n=2 Tax=Bordetella holmesii TaxID=35814 RepID=A0A158M2V0_9BORD|nr:phospholipase C, phosphocholine-specific [Bordetella holmesii]AIT26907.1 phospholipase C, phosphocholine-specific [Bordetella holmesii 44057]EWM43739.1 phospholipase C, phosphocholine-specific [Bordetella holmesii 41130]EWM47490.1 phospholipase C, phosphocholine-specific [Bordetella holmesii 35009]EWM51655.1 phospholipase C, phosphocholine-specific [Bordetella holmesii 70147]AMD45834.1 phospholipase C, phosphocholine-specific [Bordetella holmesii H558]